MKVTDKGWKQELYGIMHTRKKYQGSEGKWDESVKHGENRRELMCHVDKSGGNGILDHSMWPNKRTIYATHHSPGSFTCDKRNF